MKNKLINELPELVENRVISQDVALKIESYYQSKTTNSPNRLFVVFGVLGSILIGLGIILILGHNWDNFSKTIKTIFAFAPLVIGQLLVGFSIVKNKSRTWKEASGTFLFFAVGASMAMVSQIYNIPGDFSSYMLIWILLCAPLVYLLKSHALGILHLVYATIYACQYGYFSSNVMPWMYLVFLALIMPYYLNLLKSKPKENVTSIFNWLLALSLIITLSSFVIKLDEIVFIAYVILFGLFYNLGKLPRFDNLKLRQNGFLVLGSFGTVVLLLMSSYRWVWKEIVHVYSFNAIEINVVSVLFALALIVLISVIVKKGIAKLNLFHFMFIIMTLLVFVGEKTNTFPIIINLLLLALGINTIIMGAKKAHFGILNYGLIIISVLIFCRFQDTNMSFVIRGLLFVIIGIGFFVTNYIMLKKQKNKDTKTLK